MKYNMGNSVTVVIKANLESESNIVKFEFLD